MRLEFELDCHARFISACYTFLYAINYLFAKDVMPDYISPSAFILLRVMFATIIFFIIHHFFINEKLAKKDFLYLAMCAVFGIVINMLCFFEGLNLTTPINASLIMITTPLIVYLISDILKLIYEISLA